MNIRLLALAIGLATAAGARAFTLDPSWAGGFNGYISSPNGDTSTILTPVHTISTDSAADTLATLINGNSQWFASTPTVVRASDIAGVLSLDSMNATVFSSGDGRYFTGWNFAARFNTPNGSSIPSALRWVCLEQGDGGTWVFTNGFQPSQPYFFKADQEPSYRDGTNSFGTYNYQFGTNLATEWAPGDYTNLTTLFLVDESTDPLTGGLDVNIHDAVQFQQNYHQVAAPEPASVALIGLGVVSLLRRRRQALR